MMKFVTLYNIVRKDLVEVKNDGDDIDIYNNDKRIASICVYNDAVSSCIDTDGKKMECKWNLENNTYSLKSPKGILIQITICIR